MLPLCFLWLRWHGAWQSCRLGEAAMRRNRMLNDSTQLTRNSERVVGYTEVEGAAMGQVLNFRIARNPPRIDPKRGDRSLLAVRHQLPLFFIAAKPKIKALRFWRIPDIKRPKKMALATLQSMNLAVRFFADSVNLRTKLLARSCRILVEQRLNPVVVLLKQGPDLLPLFIFRKRLFVTESFDRIEA